MKSLNPYLLFNGNAEEAFTFYQSVFDAPMQLLRFSDMGGEGVPEGADDLVAHVSIPLGDTDILMGSDCPPGQTVNTSNPAFAVSFDAASHEEAERIFTALSAGGDISMPLGKTEWAEAFGMATDKFSVPWMVGYSPNE
ncbi:VOC family protein [Nocardia uniformis]|uniref:VOC family protein n=1 Tax=Nocardia uniformis TaxID=53432 RepID=A0A849C9Y5_9NOCA|nr:VOC family protein [Nocardia uniformis]NNH69771.1 VOC family protein [Nocardia uniformis]